MTYLTVTRMIKLSKVGLVWFVCVCVRERESMCVCERDSVCAHMCVCVLRL